jgi:hypothetical protein
VLKFNVNVLYGTHKNTNNNNAYVYRQAMIHNPSSPVYNENGSYYEEFSRFQYFNPVEIQNELIGDTRSKYARLTGNVTLEPIKGWQTNMMVSLSQDESESENYYSSKFYSQTVGKLMAQPVSIPVMDKTKVWKLHRSTPKPSDCTVLPRWQVTAIFTMCTTVLVPETPTSFGIIPIQ